MKGIILAGGKGTRLYPLTNACCKQLLPVYDKPMIYYPLSVLMLIGIRDVLIITNLKDLPLIQNVLGDGHWLGMNIEYKVQDAPNGIPEAFIIGEEFLNGAGMSCLILGDNLFFGQYFSNILQNAVKRNTGASIFGYFVKNPAAYGVVEIDNQGKIVSIEEKPKYPKSNYAIPGLYFFDNRVVEIAKSLKPSPRGELEIIDVINAYKRDDELNVDLLGRGMAWLDAGTTAELLKAASFVEAIQSRTGLYIACIEEIAYRNGFIDEMQMNALIRKLPENDYKSYIEFLLNESNQYRYVQADKDNRQ